MNIGPNHPSGAPGGSGGKGRGRRGRRHHQQNKRSPGQQRRNKDQQNQRTGGGIYTAPMDHSYRAALNGQNGNGGGKNRRGGAGFGMQYVQPDPEPLPVRSEPAVTRIFAFIDDLFFLAKIQEVSRKLNIKVEFVKTEKDIFDRVEQNGDVKPSLIIVDLNNNSIKPLTLISKLKSKLKKQTNIIGFLSHVQGDLKLKAQEAGCDMVLPRSAFSQNLPQLLRRHAADEEEEMV